MTNKKALKAKAQETRNEAAYAMTKYHNTEIGAYFVQAQKLIQAAEHLDIAINYIESANSYEYAATK